MESVERRNDPTLTIADIAKRLNMSDQFVYRQVISGKLNSYALGGSIRKRGAIRFSENQFQEYLASQINEPHRHTTNVAKINPASCTQRPNTVTNKLNLLLKTRTA